MLAAVWKDQQSLALYGTDVITPLAHLLRRLARPRPHTRQRYPSHRFWELISLMLAQAGEVFSWLLLLPILDSMFAWTASNQQYAPPWMQEVELT